MTTPDPLKLLTDLLGKLPGIGEKSALRLSLAIVRAPDPAYPAALASAITRARSTMQLCQVCCDLSGSPVCPVCSDARRDPKAICVVAQAQDRMAFERAGVFRGRYHVLHGVLDPLSGIGPNELKVKELLERLPDSDVTEVIVATSPTVEGDATALYLAKLLEPIGVSVSRIASGVAVGGDLEHCDMVTLTRALQDRRRLG